MSILRRAAESGIMPGTLLPPESPAVRDLYLQIAMFGSALERAWERRAPSELAEYAYDLASTFSAFYNTHHILREANAALQGSYLAITELTLRTLRIVLDLLGIEIPDRM